MGTLQFLAGSLAIAVVGIFFDGTPLPMVAGIAGCAGITFALAQLTLGRRRRVALEAAAE
jgi:DHA1 family bicyclomycin/chloramphenicol resistance-like MFS transporter